MYESKGLTKSKFSLGGITMGFAFFKNRDLLSRYRRKPLYLCNNSLSNALYYFVILNKRI